MPRSRRRRRRPRRCKRRSSNSCVSSCEARQQAYRSGGLSAIAGYDRGNGHILQPGTQLRHATNAATVLARFAGRSNKCCSTYPQDQPPGLDEKFHWVVFDIDGTPTLALSQRLWTTAGAGAIMVDRLFYVSSGFNTEQAVGGFLPLQERYDRLLHQPHLDGSGRRLRGRRQTRHRRSHDGERSRPDVSTPARRERLVAGAAQAGATWLTGMRTGR